MSSNINSMRHNVYNIYMSSTCTCIRTSLSTVLLVLLTVCHSLPQISLSKMISFFLPHLLQLLHLPLLLQEALQHQVLLAGPDTHRNMDHLLHLNQALHLHQFFQFLFQLSFVCIVPLSQPFFELYLPPKMYSKCRYT